MVQWLEQHENLSGWAQAAGAIMALGVTYLTVFIPIWMRKRALKAEALRLLMHGHEMIDCYHRAVTNFAPFPISIRLGALTMGAAAEEIAKFPVYELDANHGRMSFARRLMSMRLVLETVKLYLNSYADDLAGAPQSDEDYQNLRDLVGQNLSVARNLVLNVEMQRPEWPLQSS